MSNRSRTTRKWLKKIRKEAKFTAKIEGDWLFEEGGPQFRSTVKVKDGTYSMEASHPNFAGPGIRPGPMAFGLFWFAACYPSTFVTEAALRNIRLTAVKTKVEADLDYTAQFDLGKTRSSMNTGSSWKYQAMSPMHRSRT